MTLLETKILQTCLILILFFLVRFGVSKLINRTVTKNYLQKTRGKVIKKIFTVVLILIALIFILSVWGVKQSDLYLFMASVLTVIGIGLFAQWSHLSNITAGIIIFFNPHVKLDDTVIILDKEYDIEGRISDVGLFFVKLKTKEGEEITLPNNIFLQKMIKKKIK